MRDSTNQSEPPAILETVRVARRLWLPIRSAFWNSEKGLQRKGIGMEGAAL